MAAEAAAQVIQPFQLGKIVSTAFMDPAGLCPGSLSGKFYRNNNTGCDHEYIHLGSATGVAHPV